MANTSKSIFDCVRSSAQFVLDNAEHVKLNTDAVTAFVRDLDLAEFESKSTARGYPLRFDSLADEAGFWGLIDLLNIGSGFRVQLHEARGRGAFETIQRGLMGMYISGATINTKYLKEISLAQVGELFDIPLFEERDVYGGAIFMSTPGPLHPLGSMLQAMLNETGSVLEREGCTGGLGEWILRTVRAAPESEPHAASHFVEKLVETFPAFADKATYKGREVLLLKKAQLLAADLHLHLRDKEPRFNFPDIEQTTIFSDNVLPAVFRKLGILELSDALKAKIDANEELPRGDSEVELRSLAIVAADAVVAAWKRERQGQSDVQLTAKKLDYFLWTKGKDEGFRSVARHATKDTIYY